MIPSSAQRVPLHTAEHVNQQIHQQMESRLQYYRQHPEQIDQRLEELDREWDIERTLEANASTLALTGTILGATVSKTWLLLPGIVTAFLLQHAVQGWCPPLPVFRRLGFRTPQEIEAERHALLAIRGGSDGTGRSEPAAQTTQRLDRSEPVVVE